MVKQTSAKADKTFNGSGQPEDDNTHTNQSNDGGVFTEQQGGGQTNSVGAQDVNDQSQNRQQTDENLDAQQKRQAGDVGTVEPAAGADPNGPQYNNPDNPAVETRPAEQTSPNEETPGYEPQS
jgi:hypothetical protein